MLSNSEEKMLNIWKIQFSIVEYLKNYSEISVESSQSGSLLRNLTSRQIQMLVVVRQFSNEKQQGVSLMQLAKFMNVKSPAASAMVNCLVKMGFLKRDLCVQDRREIRIVLSSKIRKRFELYDELLNKKVKSVMMKMGKKKAEMLHELLEEMDGFLRKE